MHRFIAHYQNREPLIFSEYFKNFMMHFKRSVFTLEQNYSDLQKKKFKCFLWVASSSKQQEGKGFII